MQHGRDRLRDWIERSRLKQYEAAAVLGMSDVFLSQILNGVRTPALENAVKIERVTGVSVESWLLKHVSDDDEVAVAAAPKRKIAKR